MNNILDQITTVGSGNRSATGIPGIGTQGISTDVAMANFGSHIPFRNQLQDVRGLSGQPLLAKAGLDWKAVPRPVLIEGIRKNRTAKGYQGIVRSDTGDVLSITSDRFQVHQNPQILASMEEMAAIGQANIVYAGGLDGGRKVVAVAQLPGEFTLPDERGKARIWNGHSGNATPQNGEDKTALFALISGGHEPGTPCKIRGLAFRKWCGNGAFFTANATSTISITHRNKLTTADIERLKRTFESIAAEFDTFGRTARQLQQVEMNYQQSRLFVAELLKPGITAQIAEKLGQSLSSDKAYQQVWVDVAHELRGRQALNQMLKASEEEPGFARTGKNVLDAILEQEGANGDNLWTGFNGVTYYVDHLRGRSVESGTDAALFGAGADLKERALETAVRFAN